MLARPTSEATFTNLGSHVPSSCFFLTSAHAFVLCVGVFTCNGLLYLQLDRKQILGGAEQEKQHNGLDKKHSDKHSNVTSRSVTVEG